MFANAHLPRTKALQQESGDADRVLAELRLREPATTAAVKVYDPAHEAVQAKSSRLERRWPLIARVPPPSVTSVRSRCTSSTKPAAVA